MLRSPLPAPASQVPQLLDLSVFRDDEVFAALGGGRTLLDLRPIVSQPLFPAFSMLAAECLMTEEGGDLCLSQELLLHCAAANPAIGSNQHPPVLPYFGDPLFVCGTFGEFLSKMDEVPSPLSEADDNLPGDEAVEEEGHAFRRRFSYLTAARTDSIGT